MNWQEQEAMLGRQPWPRRPREFIALSDEQRRRATTLRDGLGHSLMPSPLWCLSMRLTMRGECHDYTGPIEYDAMMHWKYRE